MRIMRWTALACASWLLSACHHPAPNKSQSSARARPKPSASASRRAAPASSGQASRPEDRAKPSEAAVVKLLDAGKPPRIKLRYHFVVGHVERVALTTSMSLSLGVGDETLPVPTVPGVELDVQIRVLGITPDGAARRAFDIDRAKVLDEPGVSPSARREVEDALQGFDKLSGHDEMTPQGLVRDTSFDARTVADPRVKQLTQSTRSAFGDMSAPFPREAVGVGARWQVQSHVVEQGMHMLQTATYELTRLRGKTGSMRVTLAQTAPRGALHPPGLPKHARAELLSMDARGGGQLEFNLVRMVPDGHLGTEMKVKARVEQGGQSEDSGMSMSLRVEFHPETGRAHAGAHGS